jgi:hypothetical protein
VYCLYFMYIHFEIVLNPVTSYVISCDKLHEICHLTKIICHSQSFDFAAMSIVRLCYTSRHLFIALKSEEIFLVA